MRNENVCRRAVGEVVGCVAYAKAESYERTSAGTPVSDEKQKSREENDLGSNRRDKNDGKYHANSGRTVQNR